MTFSIFSAVAIVFAIVGVAFLIQGRSNLRKGRESLSWTPTSGQITWSDVHRSDPDYDSDSNDRLSIYEPRVTYAYIVNGQWLTSERITFRDLQENVGTQAAAVVQKYPAGQAVTVYYDPQDPTSSVLEPGGGSSSTIFILAAAFICFGIGGFILSLFGVLEGEGHEYQYWHFGPVRIRQGCAEQPSVRHATDGSLGPARASWSLASRSPAPRMPA